MSLPKKVTSPYDANTKSSIMDTTHPHGSLNLIVLVLLGIFIMICEPMLDNMIGNDIDTKQTGAHTDTTENSDDNIHIR